MTTDSSADRAPGPAGRRWSDADWRHEMDAEIRRLEEQVRSLAEMMRAHMEQERAQQEQIDRLIEELNRARGGISALLWLGGALATLAAGAAWLWEHAR